MCSTHRKKKKNASQPRKCWKCKEGVFGPSQDARTPDGRRYRECETCGFRYWSKRKPGSLTDEQVSQMLRCLNRKSLTGLRDLAGLVVMLRTGIRVAELCDLLLADVNINGHFIQNNGRLEWDGQAIGPFVHVRNGKGGRPHTYPVPFCPTTLEILQEWAQKKPPSEWFVCCISGSKRGDHMGTAAWRFIMKTVGRKVGLEPEFRVSPHSLRRYCAEWLRRQGYSDVDIRDWLGHKNIATTSEYLGEDTRRSAEIARDLEPLVIET